MKKQRQFLWRVYFFAALALGYAALFLLVRGTGFYDVTGAHNDRVLSADDVYLVTEFFSPVMDDSARIIKHPLLILFGCMFTRLEGALLGPISAEHHYMLIVIMQIVVGWLSAVVLDTILEEQYRLDTGHALLMCAIYGLSFSTLFYMLVGESYIYSALILLLSFYFARRQNIPVTAALGVLAAGITITNAALWAAIVVCSGGTVRRRISVLALGGGGFCAAVALTPMRAFFFTRLVPGALGSAGSFRDHFSLPEAARRVFFAFFGSTSFYLDTVEQSAFDEFPGDALSFVPSACVPVAAAGAVWLAVLAWAAWKYRRSPLLYAPLAVLGCNLLLHGLIQYGLKEAFLYSLHHLPAQMCIAALPLTPAAHPVERRAVTAVLAAYAVCLVALNLPGYWELARYLMR